MDQPPPGQVLPWGPPVMRANVVRRRRLLDRLDAALAVGAVRVNAAAGSGKTTLLASWLATLPDTVRSTWLTLRPGHNDPMRLADDLRTVLRHQRAPTDRLSWAGSLGQVLAGFMEPMPNAPVVLVLDDVHVIEDASVVDVIADALDHVPSGSCIVLSGRHDPGLPWDMLRERRAMVELDDTDLRFTEDEADRLLRRAFGIDAQDSRIASAVAAAEGWAAGLVLAGVAWQAQPDEPVEVLVSPRHRRFIDGFIEEAVLAACTPELRDFLHATSVLPVLEPALCDLLTGRQDSTTVLRELANRNMLTDELAGRWPAFRYHALLRRVLRERLGPRDRARLHDRAERVVQMLADQGRLVEATDLALLAGPPDDAEKWVRQACGPAMTRGYAPTVVRWLSTLPPDQLSRQPDLLLVLARAAGVTGDLLTAKAAVRQVRLLVDSTEVSRGVRIGLQTLDAAVRLWEGSLTQSTSSLRDLLSLLPEQVDDPVLEMLGLTRASLLAPLAAGLLLEGKLDQAVDLADQALGLDELAPMTRHAVLCLGVRPLARAWAGREPEAATYIEEAMPLVAGWRAEGNEAILFWAAAAWVGPLARAEQSLACAQRLTSRTAVPLLKALPAVTELRVRQRLGQYDRLAEAAQRAESAMALVPEPGHLTQVLRDELLLAQQRSGSAPELTEQELAILQGVAEGRSRKEVARQLHYSVNTVKTYLRSTYRKLGVGDRAEAVTRARAWGLLE